MTRALGLDLGSRRSKAVLLEEGKVADRRIFQSWAFDKPQIVAWVEERRAAGGHPAVTLGTTGYARHAAASLLQGRAITEIRAFGRGAEVMGRNVRSLVDIGGQDAKAIALGADGRVDAFEMNDRCAAGTGKFFELLATTLGVEFHELEPMALQAAEAAAITSTCAVFAESEIVGRLAEGASPGSLARGVFRAVSERLAAMVRRTGFGEPAFLVGGGANACLAEELSRQLGIGFALHPDGPFLGAIGAAWHGAGAVGEGTHV